MLPVHRRALVALLSCLVLVTGTVAAASMSVGAAPVAQVQTSPATTASSYSASAAKQHVEALATQIGSRPAGSANYDRAVQYVADQVGQWGYQPTVQSFPVETYDDRGALLEAVSAGLNGVQAATLAYSVAGDVQAPLVAAGLGQVDELAAADVRGKVALLRRGTLRFQEKVANAAAAGAVGVVVYNDAPGPVQGSLGRQEAVPAVTISGEDGQRLLGALGAGALDVRLAVDASLEQRASSNVIAELASSQPGAPTVVIGAHLDSVPAGPGANDNGSGSGAALELARTLAQADPAQRPFAVRFIWFGAEELGLFGSRHYVSTLSDAERRSIVAMINLDMVGVGQQWRFGGSDALVQRALGAATDLGATALPMRGPLSSSSDHASFAAADIPVLFLYRSDDPNYHTANDRAEFVDPDVLGQAGTITLRVLDSLANQQLQ